MGRQKIQGELKSITKVTSFQLIVGCLCMGVMAGIFASFILGVQDSLNGGAGRWGVFLMLGIILFAGITIGCLKFKHKARNLSINHKSYRIKIT